MFNIQSPFAHGTQVFSPTQTRAAAGADVGSLFRAVNPQTTIKAPGRGASSNPLAAAAALGEASGSVPGVQASRSMADSLANAQHTLRVNNAGEQFANSALSHLYGQSLLAQQQQMQAMQNPLIQQLLSWLF